MNARIKGAETDQDDSTVYLQHSNSLQSCFNKTRNDSAMALILPVGGRGRQSSVV